jgi:hypothetical protein
MDYSVRKPRDCRQRWSHNDEFTGLPEEDVVHCKRRREEEKEDKTDSTTENCLTSCWCITVRCQVNITLLFNTGIP